MTSTLKPTHFLCSGPDILQQLQLTEPYQLAASPCSATPVAALDNFDNQLLQRNQVLLQSPTELFLLDQQGLLVTQLASKSMGLLPDTADKSLQAALSGVESLRRLLPVAEYTLQHYNVQLLDDDQKTCARVTLLHLESAAGVHANWIELIPLRGYGKAFSLLRQQLLVLGATENAEPVQLLQQLGYCDSGYQSNPRIELNAELTAKAAARRIISTYLTIARQNEQGLIDDLDVEFLHD